MDGSLQRYNRMGFKKKKSISTMSNLVTAHQPAIVALFKKNKSFQLEFESAVVY